MKRLLLTLAFFLPLSVVAQAPPTVTFTASNVLDAGGSSPLASGQLCFQTTDTNDRPMGYRVGQSSGQTNPLVPSCVAVTNGAIVPTSIINSAASNPLNACIRVTTLDATGAEVRRTTCVQTGTSAALSSWCSQAGSTVTCSYDSYPLGTTPLPVTQVGPPGPPGPTGPTGPAGAGCSSGGSADCSVAGNLAVQGNNSVIGGVAVKSLLSYARNALLKFLFSMHQSEEAGNAFPAKHILVHGDSTSVVCGATLNVGPYDCRNRWPDALQRILSQRYGNAGLGTTRIMAGPSNMDGVTWGVASGSYTTVNVLGPWANNAWTQFNGLVRGNSGFVLNFAANQPFVASNFYCATTSDSNGWTLTIDGVAQTNLSGVSGRNTACGTQTSTPTAVRESIPTQTLSNHTYTMTCSVGPCYAYAADATNGQRGVVIDGLGIGGCVSQCFTGAASKYAFSDLIPNQVLDISMLGINDSASGTSTTPIATYVANMQELWSHASGLGVPALAISPNYNNDGAYAGQNAYYSAMQSAAYAAGVPVLDIQQRWGAQIGPCFIYRSPCSLTGTQSDLTHFSDDGGIDIANMLAAVLIDPNGNAFANVNYLTVAGASRDSLPDAPPLSVKTDANAALYYRSLSQFNGAYNLGDGVGDFTLNAAGTGFRPRVFEADQFLFGYTSGAPVCIASTGCKTLSVNGSPARLAVGAGFVVGANGGVSAASLAAGNGFSGTKTIGSCSVTFASGIVTGVTGC